MATLIHLLPNDTINAYNTLICFADESSLPTVLVTLFVCRCPTRYRIVPTFLVLHHYIISFKPPSYCFAQCYPRDIHSQGKFPSCFSHVLGINPDSVCLPPVGERWRVHEGLRLFRLHSPIIALLPFDRLRASDPETDLDLL